MRNVRGVLFVDYVRMLRAAKATSPGTLDAHLTDDDQHYLTQRIDRDAWYPMGVFERLGNAILDVVAGGDLELVRAWGRHSVDKLVEEQPTLLAPADPVETLNRFRVLRATYFDYESLQVATLLEDEAEILIDYRMGAKAEEAASWQTVGFFERLLEVAGASDVQSSFVEKRWEGAPKSRVALRWRL